MTNKTSRIALTLSANDRQLISRAAALTGTTTADFVCTAASERARELLDQAGRITLSVRDFKSLALALSGPFNPNATLSDALNEVRRKVEM